MLIKVLYPFINLSLAAISNNGLFKHDIKIINLYFSLCISRISRRGWAAPQHGLRANWRLPSRAPAAATNWRTPANWRASRRPMMAVWPPEPPASNAKHSGALSRGFERALAPRLARDFGPQQGASWQIVYNIRMHPSTVQSNDLFHQPIHRPSRQLANRAGTPRAATNWRIPAVLPAPRGLPGMSRPPTGESTPAEHNGLAPAGSPLPSRHPALPDP